MIRTKQDYRRYLQTEIVRRGFWRDLLFREPTARFLLWLRRTEYHCNARGPWHRAAFLYCYLRYRRISLRTGISIPKNVCREGLTIPHYGSIVVNAACRIGRNCAIHNNVNIGASGGGIAAPRIGDNVYIGPGAVLYGDIEIADNCYIGANAVVNRSFTEPGSVIAGVPARVVRNDDRVWWQKNGLRRSFGPGASDDR